MQHSMQQGNSMHWAASEIVFLHLALISTPIFHLAPLTFITSIGNSKRTTHPDKVQSKPAATKKKGPTMKAKLNTTQKRKKQLADEQDDKDDNDKDEDKEDEPQRSKWKKAKVTEGSLEEEQQPTPSMGKAKSKWKPKKKQGVKKEVKVVEAGKEEDSLIEEVNNAEEEVVAKSYNTQSCNMVFLTYISQGSQWASR